MSSILLEARRLSRLGVAVHWLVPPWRGGKAPVAYSWAVERWLPPGQLEATYHHGYNLGVHTGFVGAAGHHLVVLDIDDDAAHAFACSRVVWTPLRVKTARGEQWYYLHPGRGVQVPTRQHIDGYHLDLRGEGGQVVCPPSVHATGHVYSWSERPTIELLAHLPEWSPDWFPLPATPAAVPSTQQSGPVEIGMRAFARGCGFAKRWNTAEESAGRGTQTYKLALTLVHGLGLDEQTTYGILAKFWNPRLPQPYGEALLRRKVAEAANAQRANQRLVELR